MDCLTEPSAEGRLKLIRGTKTMGWTVRAGGKEAEGGAWTHPRDPFKRVDDIPSSRHIRVEVAGQIVADSSRPVVLFETGLPERYYLPKADVRMDLLVATDTVTRCPYKGEATYYSVRREEKLVEDIAWCYRYPLPESSRIAGRICFHDERVDAVYVDGLLRGESSN